MIERVVGDADGVAVGVAMAARQSVARMRAREEARSGESGEAIEPVLGALRAELARAPSSSSTIGESPCARCKLDRDRPVIRDAVPRDEAMVWCRAGRSAPHAGSTRGSCLTDRRIARVSCGTDMLPGRPAV